MQFDAHATYRNLSNLTHWPVLLFLSGLTKPEILPLTMFEQHGHISYDMFSCTDYAKIQYLCHLLFEVQSTNVTSTVLLKGHYCLFRHTPPYLSIIDSHLYFWPMTNFDWFILGHCIAHSGASTQWEISFSMDANLDMLEKGLTYFKREANEGRI